MSATVIQRAGDQLGAFLPRLAGALLLLIVGLLAAVIIARIFRRLLVRAGLDRFADRTGVNELLASGGLGNSLSRLLATVLRLTIVVIVSFAALTLLGLQFLSDSLNQGILFIPRLLTALALVLIGVVIAAFARAWADRASAQVDFPIAIGRIVQVAVIALFVLSAAVQAGVSVAPLVAIAVVILGAVAVTLTLSFGLGAREIARSLSSGRYARADFDVGQTIRVGDIRGEILRIDAAATTLRAAGETIRIPNSILVEQIVVVEGREQPIV
jgi:small-conductance mechanosensitive channel